MSEANTIPADRRAPLLASMIMGALMSDVPFQKRLRKLDKIENKALRQRDEAVGYSNVYSIRSLRGGDRPEQMDAERELKHGLAMIILEAVERERAILAGYGFASPGHPVQVR